MGWDTGDAGPIATPIDLLVSASFSTSRNSHNTDIMNDSSKILSEMNDRSREVFRRVVETYLASGDPVLAASVAMVCIA